NPRQGDGCRDRKRLTHRVASTNGREVERARCGPTFSIHIGPPNPPAGTPCRSPAGGLQRAETASGATRTCGPWENRPVTAEVWKRRDVAAAFLSERALMIPDRPRQLDVLLRVVGLATRPVRRVLDLGAGDGLLLAAVLQAYPEARGVAVDFSPLMLEQ